jgi:2,4-dienoyl-CoA reductase-like NADH-dependent reductase (Old Yellow Enzyme family)
MIHANNGIVGIQLAHAGRKASTLAPFVQKRANDGGWKGGDVAPEKLGGWPNEGELSSTQ